MEHIHNKETIFEFEDYCKILFEYIYLTDDDEGFVNNGNEMDYNYRQVISLGRNYLWRYSLPTAIMVSHFDDMILNETLRDFLLAAEKAIASVSSRMGRNYIRTKNSDYGKIVREICISIIKQKAEELQKTESFLVTKEEFDSAVYDLLFGVNNND